MALKARNTMIAVLLPLAAVGCELTVEPESTVTETNIFNDPSSYEAFLAKIYGGLAVTGQQGPAGQGDIEGIDEGFSQYMRQYWQMQELPTDEAVIGWGDQGLPELNTHLWSSSNQFFAAMYSRVFFQVMMANEFLRQTTDAKLTERGVGDALRAQIQQFRAEARFLRALSYWHGLDLFGNIPLVTEADPLGSTPPEQATRAELFAFVESELIAIQNELPAIGMAEYGRADQGALSMLQAKLFLNAGVYVGQDRYGDALAAVANVINSGAYFLDDDYRHVFLADNHTSPEIIFAVPQDGERTRTWGGTTFLIHAAIGGNMNAGDFGVNFGWWGLRVTPEFVSLFEGGAGGADGRSGIFFTDGQSLQIANLPDFFQGYAAPKYQNVTSTGAAGSHQEFPDTDFPMFRLADAYLTYAEAVLRGGGGTRTQALTYVNDLRTRAYGDTSGNIADADLTLDFILDERARELWWEGHRRVDLIRYGRYTGDALLWAWKGGTQAGATTDPTRDLYPIPATELIANPNLDQNPGY